MHFWAKEFCLFLNFNVHFSKINLVYYEDRQNHLKVKKKDVHKNQCSGKTLADNNAFFFFLNRYLQELFNEPKFVKFR